MAEIMRRYPQKSNFRDALGGMLWNWRMPWFSLQGESIARAEIEQACARLLDEARTRIKKDLRRVLLLPPDLTRAHSGAGRITQMLYEGMGGGGGGGVSHAG